MKTHSLSCSSNRRSLGQTWLCPCNPRPHACLCVEAWLAGRTSGPCTTPGTSCPAGSLVARRACIALWPSLARYTRGSGASPRARLPVETPGTVGTVGAVCSWSSGPAGRATRAGSARLTGKAGAAGGSSSACAVERDESTLRHTK